LTLARLKNLRPQEARELAAQVEAHIATRFGTWRVDSVFLMESKLSSEGAAHFPLAKIALGSQCCVV